MLRPILNTFSIPPRINTSPVLFFISITPSAKFTVAFSNCSLTTSVCRTVNVTALATLVANLITCTYCKTLTVIEKILEFHRLLQDIFGIHMGQRLSQLLRPFAEHVHEYKPPLGFQARDLQVMILQSKTHNVGRIVDAIVQ